MAIKDAAPAAESADTEVPAGIQRDRYGRPIIDGVSYTRASSFGEPLEDMFGVHRWKLGMVAYGMGKREDLRLRAASVGPICGATKRGHLCKPPCADSEEGKRELSRIQEEALAVSGSDRKASLGTALHALTEQIDHGIEVAPQGRFDPILARYRELMAGFRVIRTEIFTVCKRWGTAGTFDIWVHPLGFLVAPDGHVFTPDDTLIVDKKTSEESRYFGPKFVCQEKTYQSGEIYDIDSGRLVGWPDAAPPSDKWALILHLPSHPELVDEAGWYWVDLTAGERLCDLALAVRRARRERNLIVPARREVTAEHPDDARRAAARLAVGSARSVAALKMAARAHASVWDDELRALARARRDAVEGEGVPA